jgi:hypothetical protein
MRALLKRVERAGFFIFFAGLFMAAIGIASGTRPLWMAGVAIVVLVLLAVLVRARRSVSLPRRPAAGPTAAGAKRPSPRSPGTTRPEDV